MAVCYAILKNRYIIIFASTKKFSETTELTAEQHQSVKSRLGLQTMPVKRQHDIVSPIRQHRESSVKSHLERETSSQTRHDTGSLSVNMARSVSSEDTISTGNYYFITLR